MTTSALLNFRGSKGENPESPTSLSHLKNIEGLVVIIRSAKLTLSRPPPRDVHEGEETIPHLATHSHSDILS